MFFFLSFETVSSLFLNTCRITRKPVENVRMCRVIKHSYSYLYTNALTTLICPITKNTVWPNANVLLYCLRTHVGPAKVSNPVLTLKNARERGRFGFQDGSNRLKFLIQKNFDARKWVYKSRWWIAFGVSVFWLEEKFLARVGYTEMEKNIKRYVRLRRWKMYYYGILFSCAFKF